MSYCPKCKTLVDTDKEWERIDDGHIKILYFCDRCGTHIAEDDEIRKDRISDWERRYDR